VNNVYRLHTIRFSHLWHKNLFPNVYHDSFQYTSNIHAYNARYAARQNLCNSGVRTNTGKQNISYMASVFCHDIPSCLKNLNVYHFSKQIKLYLFSEQLPAFALYLPVSFIPLVIFCFARKRQGNNSKTARFIYPPGSTLNPYLFP